MKPGNPLRACIMLLVLLSVHARAAAQATRPADAPTTAPTFTPEELAAGAEMTYLNFGRARRDGLETKTEVIDAKYWTDSIRSLQPIRVYLHRGNIVVVQREADGIEARKYMQSGISSYLLRRGDDGFEATPLPRSDGRASPGTGVYDYQRPAVPIQPRPPLPRN